MASPLDHNPHCQHYWSTEPRDTISCSSVCHPIHDKNTIYSAIHNTEATAILMFFPVWGTRMITHPYSKFITAYPHHHDNCVLNLEPFYIPTFATTIHNPAPTRKSPLSAHLGPANYYSLEYSCKDSSKQSGLISCTRRQLEAAQCWQPPYSQYNACHRAWIQKVPTPPL
eukprot:1145288-Pelagomonas_calceolata.AAC.3